MSAFCVRFLALSSVCAMIAVIVIHWLTNKNIPWLYITFSSLIYFLGILWSLGIAVKANPNSKNEPDKVLANMNNIITNGLHFSYLLLAGGTFLVNGFWTGIGVLISAICMGMIISFFLLSP